MDSAPLSFKKEGNKQQYKHPQKGLNLIELVEDNIASLYLDSAKATTEIKERHKLIRLANRYELSWGVVKEDVADNFTSNPNDAKRIKKAEKAAAARNQLQGNDQVQDQV